MKRDAALIAVDAACEICADLGIRPGRVNRQRLLYLCEAHDALVHFRTLGKGIYGICLPEMSLIQVSADLPEWAQNPVVLHELAHHLALNADSERLTFLNCPVLVDVNPREFHELIAVLTEFLLSVAGGDIMPGLASRVMQYGL